MPSEDEAKRSLLTEFVERLTNVLAFRTNVELQGLTCHGDVTVLGRVMLLLRKPFGAEWVLMMSPADAGLPEPAWSARVVSQLPWTDEADARREFEVTR